MLLDYNWNNSDNNKKIINDISLKKLEAGEYKSFYTNDQKANNIKTDQTNVYKKNWYAALIFRVLEPQIPITKNIGINILSKNI